MKKLSDIAMVGMAVMGENLALNMEEHGFHVTVFDVREGIVDAFLAGKGAGKCFLPAHTWQELIDSLTKPRRIMLMIKAGEPVDEVLQVLLPLLDEGDVVIDGGNSHFPDTQRRCEQAKAQSIHFVGMGVSGGEEGARKGPCLMPGGHVEAWKDVKEIFTAIAAKADGKPCCAWVGDGGAGHFVKMVHNGIEYGDMELICEAYHVMKQYLGMPDDEIGVVFAKWNEGVLRSYLIEITADILQKKDADGASLVEKILDTAGQKGTGKWTGIAALEEGVPLSLITEAVYMRALSAKKEERVAASQILHGPKLRFEGLEQDRKEFLEALHQALYAAKIISYAQGYELLRSAARSLGWELAFGDIAMIWRGGCIIRSAFLHEINKAFQKEPELRNLLLDDYFKDEIEAAQTGLRTICATAMLAGLPVPAFAAAVTYYDGYRSANLPANLLQAQRDYFGAHTYERVDAPRGTFFHTEWTRS